MVSGSGSLRLPVALKATEEEEKLCSSMTDDNDELGSKPSESPSSENLSTERPCLSLRRIIRIGTWNVRSMYAGKLQEMVKEMERFDVGIIGLSEVRWKGAGHFSTEDGHQVIFSGNQQTSRNGVGFLVSKEYRNAVDGYNTVNDRIALLHLKGRPTDLTLVQVYAPTSQAEYESMEEFYDTVQCTIDTVRKANNVVIVMGDWNAKVGRKSKPNDCAGVHGLGVQNERGERLEDFCLGNDLLIGNTLFKHHPRRLFTWLSPKKTGKKSNRLHPCATKVAVVCV